MKIVNLAYQKKLLVDRGWSPIQAEDDGNQMKLLGWIKEPDMQIYSTDQAFKMEVEWRE